MRFINFITKNESLLLGRWHYPKDKQILDRKIYLANYDHVGNLFQNTYQNIYLLH